MGLNAWAATLFVVAIVLSLVEFSHTKSLRDLAISFLGVAVAASFFFQGADPLLRP